MVTSVPSHVRPGDPVSFTYQTVGSNLNLSVDVVTLFFGIRKGGVDEPGVSGLADSSKDERWVCCGVLQW